MRRVLITLALSLFCLTSYAQTREVAKSQMKEAVRMTNEYLPQSLGILSIDKIDVRADDLLVYITIDENQLDFDTYISNMMEAKSSAVAMVVGENEAFGELLKKSGLNVMYVVKGNQSGREERLFYSAYDLANASDLETGLNDMIVQMVFQTRNELPQDWGNGMVLTDVYLEDGYFCYLVKVEEAVLSIEDLKEVKSQGTAMEEGMLQGFASVAEPIEKLFLKYVYESKTGIRYVFWAEESPERISFNLTPQMLSGVISNYSLIE